ncbi:MAG: PASTA domain-containing protein [Acidimicrobiales bacterium]
MTVWVSADELVSVPDVIGFSEERARDQLRSAGFRVRTEALPACLLGALNCIIGDQKPDPGLKAPQGTEVAIYLRPKLL